MEEKDQIKVSPSVSAEPQIALQEAAREEEREEQEKDVEDEEEKEIKRRIKETEIETGKCLMCPKVCKTIEGLLKHMIEKHQFLIPDIEYVKDMNGLIDFLQQKVYIGFCCLGCEKSFHSFQSTHRHMIDKRHIFISEEGEEEIIDFYDYSSSWESDSQTLSLLSAADEGKIKLSDGGYSLCLASGRVVGHRDLVPFYRQRLRPPLPDSSSSRSVLSATFSRYKALGWNPTVSQTKRDQKLQTQIERSRLSHSSTLSIKANSLQRHFRRQVDF